MPHRGIESLRALLVAEPVPKDPIPGDLAREVGDFSLDTAALLDRLHRAKAILDRERLEVPELLAETLRTPPDRRQALVANAPRFHSFRFAEALIVRSEALALGDATVAADIATLALDVANRLGPDHHPAPVVADLRARAWAAIGAANLVGGDPDGARHALRQAVEHLRRGTGDLFAEARLLEFEADIRSDEGRAATADSLLRQAATRLRQAKEPELLARIHAKRRRLAEQAQAARLPFPFVFGPRR